MNNLQPNHGFYWEKPFFILLIATVLLAGCAGNPAPRFEKDLQTEKAISLHQDLAADEAEKSKKAMEIEKKRRSGEIVLDEDAVDKNQELVKPDEPVDNKGIY